MLGPVVTLIHGAGRNEPRLLAQLDNRTFAATLAPKVDGMRNMIAALEGQYAMTRLARDRR